MEVSDGSQLSGEQYHRKIGEILNVQEEIASQISKKLQLQLRPQELKQLTKPDTSKHRSVSALSGKA